MQNSFKTRQKQKSKKKKYTNVFSAGAARALAFKTDSFFKQKHSRLFEDLKDESIQVTPTIDLAWMTPDIPNPAIWCEGGDKIALWSYNRQARLLGYFDL
jgi:hypothetical protein